MILRLWRGQVALWKAFWLFGVGGGLILGLPLFGAMLALTDVPDDATASKFLLGLGVLLGYLGLVFTGIWRAAGKYDDDRRLALAARAAVVAGLGLFSILAYTVIFLPGG